MMMIIIIIIIIIVIILIIEIIHFPYFAAVYLFFKRVRVSVPKRFLFTFLPKLALLFLLFFITFMHSTY